MNGLPPDPPEHVIMSALQWREERARKEQRKPEEPRAERKPNGHAVPLETIVAATRANKDVPAEFLDPLSEIIPLQNVMLWNGDGGTGKSTVAMQLAIACTTGTTWIGLEVSQGPVIYLSAEDNDAELTRRMNRICRADGIDLATAFELHLIALAGLDATLAIENLRTGTLIETDLFGRLAATIEATSAMLLILDNLADVYGANENKRALVKAFIGKLQGLCLRYDCTVIVLGHPSLTGISSGTGSSGSTAWNNSVRARLYLRRDKDGSGYEADKKARILEFMKANYSAERDPFGLRWDNHRFVRKALPKTFDGVAMDAPDKVKEVFKAGNYRCDERATDWGGYVVAGIIDFDIGPKGCKKEQRTSEQERARQRIIKLLAIWERGKQIGREDRPDAKRMLKPFYTG